jgi:hypothetical protein
MTLSLKSRIARIENGFKIIEQIWNELNEVQLELNQQFYILEGRVSKLEKEAKK